LFDARDRLTGGGARSPRRLAFPTGKRSFIEGGCEVNGRGLRALFARAEQEVPATVEVALPELARERAEEIVRLSHDYSPQAAGFGSTREVIGPALLYGLAHMHARYSEAALRRGDHQAA
jgi:hypothetical protein